MIAKIYVNLKRDVSDPQGLTVKNALETLSFKGIQKVHVGKYFVIELDDMNKSEAEALVKSACDKLLANPVIEDYAYEIEGGNESCEI